MVTIRPAAATDAELVGRLMADAFRDDPAWSVYLPNSATRHRKLESHYHRRVQRHPELGDVAIDDGKVVGALLWAPPRKETRATAIFSAVARFVQGIASRLPGGRGTAHTLAVDAHRPTEPHWYFHEIAASPQARGKGVGTALLIHRLAIIDGAGGTDAGTSLAALEATTPGSRRLYERFGFEAVAQVPSQPGQASTVMIRRPA